VTLLSLGITNIKLGPTLPAFATPAVLDVLVERFKISPTTTARADLEAALAG
jgi:hydroxylamine reductase